MKYSLIVSTINRAAEIIPLLDSLVNQSINDFELIIVDQNTDDRLVSLLAPYRSKLNMVIRKSAKGLSKGRNEGIKYVTGDLIAFPDDDCIYPSELLENVALKFANNPKIDVVSGRTVDSNGCTSVGVFDVDPKQLSTSDVWKNHNSISLFMKRKVIDSVGGFDETMGVGSYYASSEETDYLIRILKAKFRVEYDPGILVQHEQVEDVKSLQMNRALSYGRGVGHLLKKHFGFFTPISYFKVLAGPLFKMLYPINITNVKFQLFSVIGRWQGFIK